MTSKHPAILMSERYDDNVSALDWKSAEYKRDKVVKQRQTRETPTRCSVCHQLWPNEKMAADCHDPENDVDAKVSAKKSGQEHRWEEKKAQELTLKVEVPLVTRTTIHLLRLDRMLCVTKFRPLYFREAIDFYGKMARAARGMADTGIQEEQTPFERKEP